MSEARHPASSRTPLLRSAGALVHTWLVLDFFGDARRSGRAGSSLTTTVFGQSVLAFFVAWFLTDDRIGPRAFAVANLSLSTLLVGLGSVAGPQREARRRADRLLAATSPLPRTALPLARAVHAALQITILTVGAALPAAILLHAHDDIGWSATPLYVLGAVACAALLAGLLDLAVRLAERSGGTLRGALVAGLSRALLMAGGLVGFATCMPLLDETAASLPGGYDTAFWWPPYHAARLVTDPGGAEGMTSLGVLAGAFLVLAGAAILLRDAAGEASRGTVGARPGPFARLAAKLAGDGPLLAATSYTGTMLFRSPAFRARVLPLLSLPLALTGLALAGGVGGRDDDLDILLGIALQLPAIYTPLVVAFLPFVEGGSAQALFRTSPHEDLRCAQLGTTIALVTQLHLPVLLLAALALTVTGTLTPLAALALTGMSVALAALATRIAVRHLTDQPFTSEREAAPAIDMGQLLAGGMLLSAAGGSFATVADGPLALLVGVAAAAGAWLALRRMAAALRADLRTAPGIDPAPGGAA